MKISQKQASLLAKEIYGKLLKTKTQRVSENQKEAIKKFCDKRMALNQEKAKVQDEINKHDATLKKILGGVGGIYGGDSMTRIIEKLQEKQFPSISEIEDKIILKSMFETEDDMQKFVDGLVKEFSKKVVLNPVNN